MHAPPSRSGERLLDPPLDADPDGPGPSIEALVDNNRLLRAAFDTRIGDLQLWELVAATRREVLTVATEYTASYRDVDRPTDVAGWIARPMVMGGHQPELFHAGVWLKNFAIDAYARRLGGTAINLVVDTDRCVSTTVGVPVGTPRDAHREQVAIDRHGRDVDRLVADHRLRHDRHHLRAQIEPQHDALGRGAQRGGPERVQPRVALERVADRDAVGIVGERVGEPQDDLILVGQVVDGDAARDDRHVGIAAEHAEGIVAAAAPGDGDRGGQRRGVDLRAGAEGERDLPRRLVEFGRPGGAAGHEEGRGALGVGGDEVEGQQSPRLQGLGLAGGGGLQSADGVTAAARTPLHAGELSREPQGPEGEQAHEGNLGDERSGRPVERGRRMPADEALDGPDEPDEQRGERGPETGTDRTCTPVRTSRTETLLKPVFPGKSALPVETQPN